ncbi:MAG: hypothetical protein O6704_02470 [Nitrospinae bacterium]|nr:hypothetical protein [Nitrospinota bacterium]
MEYLSSLESDILMGILFGLYIAFHELDHAAHGGTGGGGDIMLFAEGDDGAV